MISRVLFLGNLVVLILIFGLAIAQNLGNRPPGVHNLGQGLPEEIVWRHPFPGPGLAVRCLGAVAEDRLKILRAADAILLAELRKAGLYREIQQAFAVLLPVESVGVAGDERTYEGTVAIRAVQTDDFMTADWYRMPYDVLQRISTEITNNVRGINRVVYDISSKPPSTIAPRRSTRRAIDRVRPLLSDSSLDRS